MELRSVCISFIERSLARTAHLICHLRLSPNTSFTLAWSSSAASSCLASGGWSGSKPLNGSQSMAGFASDGRTYTLKCVNSYGSTTRSVVVNITNLLLPPATPSTPVIDGAISRSTYLLAGQAIAVRVAGYTGTNDMYNGLFYLYTDHLGSASAMQKSDGSTLPTTRYTPFGNLRSGTGFAPFTDRDFTGQRENRELGLLYYQARYYLPGIGRFASADTLVPDPANPQAYNRYTYSLNSPVRFTDPTGHATCEDMPWECDNEGNWSDDGTRPKMSASGALVAYCAISDLACSGSGIGYIDINLLFLSNLAGYDPGAVSLPYHINPDYTNPDNLFPWEGVADVAYAEHSSLHPANYPEGSDEWNYFVDHWLGEATGIMQTMINRAEEPGYETANHAALNNGKFGQYAYPGRKINDNLGIYQEFYGLAFMVIQLDVRVGQPYKSFAHQDLSDLRGRSPTGNLNDVLYTDTARFGTWGSRKFWAIPGVYPYIP